MSAAGPRFGESDELQGARFIGVNLRGARFVESNLSGVVMRGIEAAELDIDAPWLPFGGYLRVNGVDVTRAAWSALESSWGAVLERAAALPEGAVDESVEGEWSFAQTLRHLVHATDLWFGKAVLGVEDPFHPLGLGYVAHPGPDGIPPEAGVPPYAEVLAARAGRVAMVRDFLAAVTPEQLDEERANPHSSDHPETVRSCVHVILEEGWEHQRFAVRDLDTIEASRAPAAPASDGDGRGAQP
jgi:hypothetical protein